MTGTRIRAWAFLAWVVIGSVASVAAVTPLTIGVFLAPIAIAAAGLLFTRPDARNGSAIGLLIGVAALVLFIAYLNRSGPGEVCTHSATAEECTDEWSPWPWLAVGLLLIALTVAQFVRLRNDKGRVTSALHDR